MKLHRIDTLNLNSLYGEQSVNLDEDLEGASLFLIHGPTGSGKSTLMDAVSLALFGETPRLDATRGDDNTDPRAIMSRGTGECSASVVFSKLDAEGRRQRYRATWACHRARKKPDGKFQSSQRSLEKSIGGEWELLVASKQPKVFGRFFEDVLEGFDVTDFNRSMLLAQGQFDAFLGAKSEERATILERLTNTDIYATLGAKVARMHKAYEERLRRLRGRLEDGGGLDAEALATLEAEHRQNVDAQAVRKATLEAATVRVTWFEGAQKLRAEIAEAEAEQVKVAAGRVAAKEELARLGEHERCEQRRAFTFLDASVTTTAAVSKHQQKLELLAQALPELSRVAKAATDSALAAECDAKRVAETLDTLRPLAGAATKHASELEAARTLERQAQEALVESERERELKSRALTSLKGQLEELEGQLAAAQREAEEQAEDPRLLEGWPALRTRLDTLLERIRLHQQRLKKRTTEARELSAEELRLRSEQGAREQARGAALGPARAAVEVAEQALAKLGAHPDYEAAQARCASQRDEVTARLDKLADARAPVADLAQERARVARQRKQIVDKEALQKQAQLTLEGKQRELERAEQAEQAAHQSLEDLRQVAALVPWRIELDDDEPCPVCGAKEHPYAHDVERAATDAKVAELLAAAQAKTEQAQVAHGAARDTHAIAQNRARAAAAALEVLESQVKVMEQDAAVLAEAARVALESCGLATETSVEQLEAQVEATRRTRDEANAALKELEAAHQAWQRSRQALRHVEEAQQRVDAKLHEDAATQAEARRRLEQGRAEDESSGTEIERERESCRGVLREWRFERLTAEPSEWRALAQARVDAQDKRERELKEIEAKFAKTRASHAGAVKLVQALEQERERRRTALTAGSAARVEAEQRAQESSARFAKAWAGALESDEAWPQDERPDADATPETRMEALAERSRALSAQSQTSAERRQRAESKLRENQTQQKERAEVLTSAKAEASKARATLDQALEALALADDAALTALRMEDAALEAARRVREELKQRETRIETLLKDRRQRLTERQAARPEGMPESVDADTLERAKKEAQEAHRVAADALQGTGDRLRDHQRFLQAQAENRERLEAVMHEASVWERLHQLIGVNDGRAFKTFAQALNLGLLLDKANHHLARLQPRYRLVARKEEGLPSLEFDIEDLWQAGATMSPRSLSGGERFLVSLALALGLSDFRTVKMPIETLLLDEGFGTLDPDTLGVALSALDQLQADGRQVGIISHVVDLQAKIPARIEVRPLGGGRSALRTCSD